jgi:hypothetical protein
MHNLPPHRFANLLNQEQGGANPSSSGSQSMIDSAIRARPLDSAQAQRLGELMISSSGFAFDPRSGLTFMVSTTGSDVIRWLNEGHAGDAVVERIQHEFDVDEHTARRDFESFLFSLRQLALI